MTWYVIFLVAVFALMYVPGCMAVVFLCSLAGHGVCW